MTDLTPFLIYVFVVTFTPGPNNILSMVNGMRYGYAKMLRFLAGIVSGFFILMFISGLLNVALANLVPHSGYWLKILGALYMFFLATTSSAPVRLKKTQKKARSTPSDSVL